jgi:hypothetical protein
MYVNPAAGALALVAQPTKGILTAMGKAKRKANDPLVRPRQETSREAFNRSTPEERQAVLKAFEIAAKDTVERKKRLKAKAQQLFEQERQAIEEVQREKKAAIEAEKEAKKRIDKV